MNKMKAKLIKRPNGVRWDLYLEEDVDMLNTIASSEDNPKGKLSLKNCQAIERGYDLDKLATQHLVSINDSTIGTSWQGYTEDIFKAGFKKALEILGDKKFSEFLDKEKELGISDIKTIERIQWYYNTYFDKSQKTEWDVKIEMQCIGPNCDGINRKGCCIPGDKPRIDSEGCLILKRL